MLARLEFLGLVPGFFSADLEQSARSLQSLIRLCLTREPLAEEMYLMLGYNLSVPPYVRQGLFARAVDNDDLLPRLRKPVLITHGVNDAVVRPAAADDHNTAIPHAQVQMMPDTGHAPFWDDAPAFNEHVRTFCERLELEPVS